ncbi:MAG: hypothetical protein L6Q57_02410 [Alphaproteobacteria bacterium]|nr:hypothetical protein [Alphaproteobacteria bacterium]
MQNGNILVYLLIAISLLAGLSFAVTQSGRVSPSQITEEKARLFASEIIEYTQAVANAVTQLRLRGVAETSLCFDADGWPGGVSYNYAACATVGNKIFSESGGGLTMKPIPTEALSPTTNANGYYLITGGNAVNNIGTSDPELVILAPGLDQSVCVRINKLLNVSNSSTPPDDGADEDLNPFQGSFATNATIGSGTALNGIKTGCYYSLPNDWNIFYAVLLTR